MVFYSLKFFVFLLYGRSIYIPQICLNENIFCGIRESDVSLYKKLRIKVFFLLFIQPGKRLAQIFRKVKTS